MRVGRRRRAAAVKGLVTALVVVLGMIAVASVTVVWSGSQQFPTRQTMVGTDASSSSAADGVPLTVVNQTTSGQVGAASPETSFVSIVLGSGGSFSLSYSPDQVTVVIGVNNTVTWVNNDNAPHTVTADDGSFGSSNLGSEGSYTHTFTEPGTYGYYCAYHSWMVGTVVVKAT